MNNTVEIKLSRNGYVQFLYEEIKRSQNGFLIYRQISSSRLEEPFKNLDTPLIARQSKLGWVIAIEGKGAIFSFPTLREANAAFDVVIERFYGCKTVSDLRSWLHEMYSAVNTVKKQQK